MSTTTDPSLARVKRAAANRRRACDQYRQALQAARDAGHAASVIGQAAGVTRQAVLLTTQRPAVKDAVYEDDNGRPGRLLPDNEPMRVGASYWYGLDPQDMKMLVAATTRRPQ